MSDVAVSPPLLTAAALVDARRVPPFPFAVLLNDGSRLEMLRPLRVLPGKRVVGEGFWNGTRVLAKLFVASGGVRHWRRELDGLKALMAAGIPTPALLAFGALKAGGRYLLTEFVPDAHTLADDLAAGGAQEALAAVCVRLGELHAHGLVHGDPHPRNFLFAAAEPLIIDGDAVRHRVAPLPGKEADANFALFLAQLSPDQPLEGLLAAYRKGNAHHVSEFAALQPLIERYRLWRLKNYLPKTVRSCTAFEVRRNPRRFTAVARGDAEWLAPLLADPDRALSGGVLLKDGNTATVARVDFAGRALVVKRYNVKNAAHALSRAWRPSRAWHSWREAHRLRFLGIGTPQPRALIEERLGPLRRRAWFIADYHDGRNLLQVLAPHIEDAAPPEAVGAALLRFVEAFHRWRIGHGDFKASNLLWDETRQCVVVIDLDAMVQHAHVAEYACAWRRDRARLLANWPAGSGLWRWLNERLPLA
ncbi:MAG: lipopolysaccharide kinase InaA family protein [Azoarcus sp.]|jgi:tRNA A-37 threonylcarbamoyl transferase component Bud32|nr:lipopolysaccharide kinase InaA family protein [Azoarcus sp.]